MSSLLASPRTFCSSPRDVEVVSLMPKCPGVPWGAACYCLFLLYPNLDSGIFLLSVVVFSSCLAGRGLAGKPLTGWIMQSAWISLRRWVVLLNFSGPRSPDN